MTTIAIDFEAEYSNEINLRDLGNYNYARATNIFMVALYSQELSLDYVGPLERAPWHIVARYPDLVAHNAGFDSGVFAAAQEKGQIPPDLAVRWSCSADLSAHMLLGRSLANAVRAAYGTILPKEVRTRAKNKRWEDLSSEKREEYAEYCRMDARYSYRLWTDYHEQWPSEERKFAEITRLRSQRGVTVDVPKTKEALGSLALLKQQAEAQIPWAGDGGPVLSIRRVKAYCRDEKIIPPESLAEKHHACLLWEETYGAEYPIVGALRQWRKSNMYEQKLRGMLTRIMPDGRMPVDLKYFGAEATGRMSGAGGWNIQNLPREPYAGVDVRSLLIPAPGFKFVIVDYQAIEPRVTAWICQSSILPDLAQGHNIYEADARIAGLWDGEKGTLKKSDSTLYSTIKASSLGLAYGLGFKRLGAMAKTLLNLEWTLEQCQQVSLGWHARNPGVKQRWKQLEQGFRDSVLAKETFSVQLPSGRSLKYFEPALTTNRYAASRTIGSPRKRYYWGGTLFENVIQATARDILRDAILRLESAGIPVVFSAHDEIVAEVPADFDAREISMLMLAPPTWAKGLPLGIELSETQAYKK